jgi:hypothetical protein
LKKEYPGDLEIELNYRSPTLEQKNLMKQNLLHHSCEKPTSFVAHLGFEIPYLILKNLRALINVNIALELSPANPGAGFKKIHQTGIC